MRLLKPDYFRPGQVLCKSCGVEIAGVVGVGRRAHFENHPNYRELKILFDDGSMHVTNCCSTCLPKLDNPTTLDKLHLADLHYMEKEVPELRGMIRNRRAVRIVAATNRPVALQ